jgi:hypothetical protein
MSFFPQKCSQHVFLYLFPYYDLHVIFYASCVMFLGGLFEMIKYSEMII